MVIWLYVAGIIWILNIGFGFWRASEDLLDDKPWQGAIGFLCLIGVNAVMGWFIYVEFIRATDL